MNILARDSRGVLYSFDGRWSAEMSGDEVEDELTTARLNLLRQLDRLGRKAFPNLEGWSDELPPRRQFEDNLLVARDMGLEVDDSMIKDMPVFGEY